MTFIRIAFIAALTTSAMGSSAIATPRVALDPAQSRVLRITNMHPDRECLPDTVSGVVTATSMDRGQGGFASVSIRSRDGVITRLNIAADTNQLSMHELGWFQDGMAKMLRRGASVRIVHTEANAKAFCVEYSSDHSQACVRRTMRGVRLRPEMTANCRTGAFTGPFGTRFQFRGKRRDASPEYSIVDLGRREELDGTGASGYSEVLEQYAALCGRPS